MTPQLLNNRYQIVRALGAGGFGNTFLAEDTQMPSGRRCVIKELRPVANNPQIYQIVQERFQREAAILENLGEDSNSIPSLYAYFETGGQFYLVQQWIEGETIAQKVQKQGCLSESSVREIIISLLPVLDYVHSRRIVHRDIKPDNIILCLKDNQPVLIDFGAVKETMGTMVNSQGMTTSSIVIGTPGYMAAEQGIGRPVYASDLYSLGLTAIYALTGKQPQDLQTDPSNGEFLWQQYASSISPSLAAVLNKAVQSHPRDRFTSASEMLQALQSSPPAPAYTPPPVPAYTPTLPSPPSSPSSPSPLPVTLNVAPPPESNSSNALIIGSLVASGLIGAAVVIALAINKQSTQTTTGTNSASSVNSSVPATANPSTAVAVSTPAPAVSYPPSVAVEPPPSRPASNLASEAGINYSYLENLLASGKLKSADRETTNLMVQMGNPARSTYLDPQSFWRIPCTDLQTIDRLWRQYSDGKFGFSIQKGIWQQVGQSKSQFDRYVGWSGRKYDNIIFSSQAPTGHLPYIRVLKHEEFFNGDRCF
jgi:serine/threonine-protein kinase